MIWAHYKKYSKLDKMNFFIRWKMIFLMKFINRVVILINNFRIKTNSFTTLINNKIMGHSNIGLNYLSLIYNHRSLWNKQLRVINSSTKITSLSLECLRVRKSLSNYHRLAWELCNSRSRIIGMIIVAMNKLINYLLIF